MSDEITKQPAETYILAAEFADKMPAGASLNAGSVNAYDMAGNDVSAIVLDSQDATVSGTKAQIRVKAGTHGVDYRLRFLMTLSNGDIREEDVRMHVEDL